MNADERRRAGGQKARGPGVRRQESDVRAQVLFIQFVAIFLCQANPCGAQTRLPQGETVQRIAAEEEVKQDYVRFTNGDVLTGEVREITDGEVRMTPEMAGQPFGENALAIPVDAVKEVVFKNNRRESSFAADRIVLVNGESLLAKVTGMRDGKILAELPSFRDADGVATGFRPVNVPQASPPADLQYSRDAHATLEISLSSVAAIGFYRKEEILAEEDFSSGLPPMTRFEGGRWSTQNGWLLQTISQATESFASLPLSQTGVVVYEWTVNTTVGRSTGLYFMASDPGISQKRAYFVRVLRNYVYLYVCADNQEVHCGSYRISLHRSRNEVRLTCDSDRGLIEASIDGLQVGRWLSSVPIKTGKYVVLRADGRGAFDDFRVVQKAGASRPDIRSEKEEGTILRLVNGDRIIGGITDISERVVSLPLEQEGETGPNPESVRSIEKEKLLYVRFSSQVGEPPLGLGGTVVLLTRSDDRISGELLGLNEEGVRLKSTLAGTLDLPRGDVKKVIFREFP